jgi:hypothetical protein
MPLDEGAQPDDRHHAARVLLDGQISDCHRRFIASIMSRTMLAVAYRSLRQQASIAAKHRHELSVLSRRNLRREHRIVLVGVFSSRDPTLYS